MRLVEEGARVLVVDPRLPELADGQALAERVSATWPDVQIVIMGWGEAGDSRLARTATAFGAKSIPPEEFVAAALAGCGYRLTTTVTTGGRSIPLVLSALLVYLAQRPRSASHENQHRPDRGARRDAQKDALEVTAFRRRHAGARHDVQDDTGNGQTERSSRRGGDVGNAHV